MGSAREVKSASLTAAAVVAEQLPILVLAQARLRIFVEPIGGTRIANVRHPAQEARMGSVPVAKHALMTATNVLACGVEQGQQLSLLVVALARLRIFVEAVGATRIANV